MSGSHEKLPWLFWVQLILVAIVGTLYLLAPTPEKHDEADAHGVSSEVKAAADNLKPVGNIAVKSNATAGSSKPRSGEKVYNAACTACHTAGIANAPKPDDKAAWESRVALGMDGLLKTAINGKGAMPPRGGNPAVTDEELKNAILYMTKKAGFDLASAGKSDKKEETNKTSKAAESSNPPATKDTPVAKEQEKVVTTPPAQPVMEKTPEPATPPTAPKAPAAPVAAITTPVPTATNPAVATTKAKAVATDTVAVAAAPAPKEVVKKTSNAEGEKLYNAMCFSCHATGVANAPKLDDKASWAARIATGSASLYNSAINGKGVMPPKGGNLALSDDAVKAAVDFMVSKVQ